VINGDTLHLDGITWPLHGIDAPEMEQVCADGIPLLMSIGQQNGGGAPPVLPA
jgi:endonuclease YncB( thermonuclease family)